MDDTIERVNIAAPRRVLRRIDAKASAVGETRSSYIGKMAVDGPEHAHNDSADG